MKIEVASKPQQPKLKWDQCKVGEVYQYISSLEQYYLKTTGSGLASGINLRTGSTLSWLPSDQGWTHVPNAKLVV